MLAVGLQAAVPPREGEGDDVTPSRVVGALGPATDPYVPSSQSIVNGTQTSGSGWTDLRDSDNVRYSYREVDRGSPSSASLLPNVNGDTTSWTAVGCTEANEWDCVNEDPNDGDGTYVKSTAKTVTDSLENLGTVNLNGGTVTSVVVWIWCRRTASQSVGVRTLVKTHGVVYAGASNYNCPNSPTYGSTSTTYATNPYTGAAWTQAEVDALQAGCRDNDGSTREVRCTEVRVDVTYVVPKYSLEVRFAWSGVPLTGDRWTLVAEGNRSNPGAETLYVQVGQGGNPQSNWVTAYTFNTDLEQSFSSYVLSAAELNGGAPVVRIWDNQGLVDGTPGTMGLDVLRIDRAEYRTGSNPWHYHVDGVVNADTGNLHLTFRDLTVKALGWDLAIARAYNHHLADVDGLLGHGWTFPYDTRIVEEAPGIAQWWDLDGSVHTFRLSGSTWVAPPGIDTKLTKSGTFILWFKDGSTHAFNAIGRLATMTDRNGKTVTVTWNPIAPLRITNVADASGLQLNFTYGIYGPTARIRQVFDPIGRILSYEYDGSGDLRTYVDAMGNRTYYVYDGSHRMLTWREPGDPMQMPPPLVRRTGFAYDAWNRVREVRHAAVNAATNATQYEVVAWSMDYVPYSAYPGAVRYANATNARSVVTTIDVDASGSPLRVKGPSCEACACLGPASAGRETSSGRGCGCSAARGSCSGATASCSGSADVGATEEVTLTWSSNREVLTRTDKGNHRFTYTYDTKRNLLNTTDPLGNVTRNVWTNADNATAYLSTLNKTTNARLFTWFYEYDGKGNLKQVKDPTNNVSKYAYTTKGYVSKVTDWRGFNTTFDYDAHGYLLNRTDATNNKTTYQNDGVGRVTRITHADSHYSRTEYDQNDRVTRTIDELNNATSLTWSARNDLLTRRDSLGRVTTYEWNATNHLLARMIDALGNSTTFGYDPVGSLVRLANPRGFNTTLTYDNFNRQTVVKDALNNETQYTYDGDGLVISVRNRREFRTNYTYDANHRVKTVKDALGNVTSYDYDQVGNLVKVKNGRGIETIYTYDALNRMTRVTDALGDFTRYDYDTNGNVVTVQDPNGNQLTMNYDGVNRDDLLVRLGRHPPAGQGRGGARDFAHV
jgi:YD repeat-containing protein